MLDIEVAVVRKAVVKKETREKVRNPVPNELMRPGPTRQDAFVALFLKKHASDFNENLHTDGNNTEFLCIRFLQ